MVHITMQNILLFVYSQTQIQMVMTVMYIMLSERIQLIEMGTFNLMHTSLTQMNAAATTPVSESATTHIPEIYKFHTKLAKMAEQSC